MRCRVFKTRGFDRWMRKTALHNENLCEGVSEMQSGLIDADLGGGVVKKRIALPGRGKRSGGRVLVGTNKSSKWFFIVGFEKSVRTNIDKNELQGLQDYSSDLLALNSQQLRDQLGIRALLEICHEK